MADPIVVNIQGLGPVNFPPDFTPEKIKFAIENDILPRVKAAQAPKKSDAIDQAALNAQKPSKLERFGRGFADIAQGVKQGALLIKDLVSGTNDADPYTADKTEELQRYERGRGPDAGVDLLRLGGNVAATLPISMLIPGGAAASLTGRAASGAAQGATAGGAMFTPEGQSKGEQMTIGALTGGAVPAAVHGIKRLVSPITDAVQQATGYSRMAGQQATQRLEGELTIRLQKQGIDFNALTAQARARLLDDAKKALDTGGSIDDAMLANKATIESIPGAKATKASITRAPRDWQEEKNLRGIQGVGDEIVSREQSNAQAMTEYLQALRSGSGGKAGTQVEAGESAVNALKVADKSKERAVGELYNAFRDSGLKEAAVPETKLTESLTKLIDEMGLENLPAAVQSRLKEFGFIGGQRTRYLNVAEADKFNRLLNANNPGHGPAARAIGMLKGALNESLIETPGGGELLTKAREAAAQRFKEAEASKGISAALGDVSPDKFMQRFIHGADVKDLRATVAEMRKTDLGQRALKDIKGTIFDDLLMKATNSTSVNDVAFKATNKNLQFSGKVFAKALDAIAPEKLHQLFAPEELKALRTLQSASRLLTEEVPFSDVNHSKTASALANLLLKVGNTPLLGAVASPILGTAKMGLDWVENANTRKQVAEALIASAAKPGAPKPLPKFRGERLLPASAAGVVLAPQAGER